MLKIKDCVRCSGATVPDYEGRICINCGHADYTVNMGNSIKEKKEIDPNLKLVNTFIVRRKGKGERAWATHEATVYIMSVNGQAKESFRFDMMCPYAGCHQLVPRKSQEVCQEERYLHGVQVFVYRETSVVSFG